MKVDCKETAVEAGRQSGGHCSSLHEKCSGQLGCWDMRCGERTGCNIMKFKQTSFAYGVRGYVRKKTTVLRCEQLEKWQCHLWG